MSEIPVSPYLPIPGLPLEPREGFRVSIADITRENERVRVANSTNES